MLATLVRVEGSSYRRPGARLLVTADGRRIGAISGGCLEADLVERACGVLASGEAEAGPEKVLPAPPAEEPPAAAAAIVRLDV